VNLLKQLLTKNEFSAKSVRYHPQFFPIEMFHDPKLKAL
jgi:hypothetical protein